MSYLGNSPLNSLFGITPPVTLTAGQTSVVINYTPGRTIFVMDGGILTPGIDYTETNGNSLTLTTGATAGSVIFGVSLASFAVANALPLGGGILVGPVTGPASSAEGAAGLIALATTALAQGLTNDSTALTPKKLADAFKGSNQSMLVNGYAKLPGGLIIQWGATSAASPGAIVSTTFPLAFPTAPFIVVACPTTTGANTNKYSIGISALTSTTFNMTNNSDTSGAVGAYWVAVGR